MSTVSAAAIMERLGIDRDSFRALGLLPLVHVAWADGKVQMGERSVIRTFAKQKGWLTSRVEMLLERWLTTRPTDEDVADGAAAFAALASERRGLGASIPLGAIDAIMRTCKDVAEASGGMFGFRPSICEEEDQALQRVADSLGLAQGKTWREVCDAIDAAPLEQEAPGSLGRFLVGKAPEMLKDPLQLLTDSWRRFGDVVKIDLGPTFFHLAVHPDDVKHVLVDNVRNYVRDEMVEGFKRIFGDGLLTSEGEVWRIKRRNLQPGFHMQKINGMAGTMVEVTTDLVATLEAAAEAGQPIDVVEETSRLALRVASRALFHTEAAGDAAALKSALPVILEQIADRHRSIVRLPEFLPTAANRRLREAIATVDKLVYRTIADRRSAPDVHDDLLSLLFAVRDDETGQPMTDQELRDEIALMLLAGHETTSTALTWTLMYLSKYPTIAREVRAEVRRVLDGAPPTVAALPKLELLTQVLEESMRIRPPAWLITRKAVGEDRLSGHQIPAGSNVIITPYLTHRHPKFWPNPEGFDPGRFSAEAVKSRHPMAYLPFSGGPRKCIGMSFAMMEMQIALAMILSSYELCLVPGFEPKMNATVTLRPLDGCWMTVHRV